MNDFLTKPVLASMLIETTRRWTALPGGDDGAATPAVGGLAGPAVAGAVGAARGTSLTPSCGGSPQAASSAQAAQVPSSRVIAGG
jgi:hypothetical protein